VEDLHHRARDRFEGRLEREALGEGARDVVQGAELVGRLTLGLERPLEDVSELLRPLVEARVLDGDGELRRERDQERLLALAVRPRARLEDAQSADHLVPDGERHEEGAADVARRDDRAHVDETGVGARVRDDQETA
jgi:hypothetical protein